jgi:REP element-mobilizing transposase RayT
MVIGYHLIWTAYGWWLPNDPRGSMSRVIRNDVIADLGELHHGRKRVQPTGGEIREFYREAAKRLKHELLTFDGAQRDFLGECFAEVITEHRYTCYACAIMPDHIHILIRKHRDHAEDMILNLHNHSRLRFRESGLRSEDHPLWGGPGWKVFLDTPDDIRRTIHYIENNPIKIRLPAQNWPFVTPYNNWPFHRRR